MTRTNWLGSLWTHRGEESQAAVYGVRDGALVLVTLRPRGAIWLQFNMRTPIGKHMVDDFSTDLKEFGLEDRTKVEMAMPLYCITISLGILWGCSLSSRPYSRMTCRVRFGLTGNAAQ